MAPAVKAFCCTAMGSSTNSSILTVVNPAEAGARVPCGGDSWAKKNLAPCVLVGCHLRRKVVEIAKSHEAVNRRVAASQLRLVPEEQYFSGAC